MRQNKTITILHVSDSYRVAGYKGPDIRYMADIFTLTEAMDTDRDTGSVIFACKLPGILV